MRLAGRSRVATGPTGASRKIGLMGVPMVDGPALRLTPILTVGILAAILGTAGCSTETTANQRTSTGGSTMSAIAVRTDRDPLTQRFPKLGDFVEAHWQGWLVGDSDVPGPSDVMIQGFVVLQPADLVAITSGYAWETVPTDWNTTVNDELRAYIPGSADWRYNRQFELDVRTTSYSGTVYLDITSGTVYLSLNSQ